MPAGVPSHVGRLKSLFPRLPDPVVRAIVGAYLRYSWAYTKLVTWYHYGRKYDAPIRPFELYNISPDKIQYQPINKKGTTWECSVKAGDWDINVTAFDDENLVHRSFIQRFVENKDWESTDLYSHAKEKIESDGAWPGQNSVDGIVEELRLYDNMYDKIKKTGIKRRRSYVVLRVRTNFRTNAITHRSLLRFRSMWAETVGSSGTGASTGFRWQKYLD